MGRCSIASSSTTSPVCSASGLPRSAKAAPPCIRPHSSAEIPDEDYILYHWHRLVHDEHLMQYASGTLSRRDWPALACSERTFEGQRNPSRCG